MSLNITSSKQTTIKLGPHKGEEMYVMKVEYLMLAKEIKDALNATSVRITCRDREGNEVKKNVIHTLCQEFSYPTNE